MLFGSGVDRRGEVLDLGVQLGLVAKSGAWFSLGELALPPRAVLEEGEVKEDVAEAEAAVRAVGEWPLMMGQGREKVRECIYVCRRGGICWFTYTGTYV